MPTLLTEEYSNKTYWVKLKSDNSEGFWAKPLTHTQRETIRKNAIIASGNDNHIASELAVIETIKTCLVDWKGYFDKAGQELPYTIELVEKLYKYDPKQFNIIYSCIVDIAQLGEIDNQKN